MCGKKKKGFTASLAKCNVPREFLLFKGVKRANFRLFKGKAYFYLINSILTYERKREKERDDKTTIQGLHSEISSSQILFYLQIIIRIA